MMRCEQTPTGRAAAQADRMAAAIPELETDRLRLRAPRAADFATYAEIACGPRGRFLGHAMSRADAWYDFANMVAAWTLHGHGLWTIEPAGGGAPLGFVVVGLEPGDAAPELGFMLTGAAEGRGIAEEAARAARGLAREDLGLTELVSYVDPANHRSVALAERLGARRAGTVGDSLVFDHVTGGA